MRRKDMLESPLIFDLMLSVVQVLTKRGVKQPAALAIGREIADGLCAISGGMRERVPRDLEAVATFTRKVSDIYDDLTDMEYDNLRELAKKHGMSEKRAREYRSKKLNILNGASIQPASIKLEDCIIEHLPRQFLDAVAIIGLDNADKVFQEFSGVRLYLGRTTEVTRDAERLSELIGADMASKLIGFCHLVVPSRRSVERKLIKHRVIQAFEGGKNPREIIGVAGRGYSSVMYSTREVRREARQAAHTAQLKAVQEEYERNEATRTATDELFVIDDALLKYLPEQFTRVVTAVGFTAATRILNVFTGKQLSFGKTSQHVSDTLRVAAHIGAAAASKLCGLGMVVIPSKREVENMIRTERILVAHRAGRTIDEIVALYDHGTSPIWDKRKRMRQLISRMTEGQGNSVRSRFSIKGKKKRGSQGQQALQSL